MTNFKINYEWSPHNDARPEVGETSAHVRIFLDGFCLTKNENIWSNKTNEEVYVSLYPLAMWLASSWWRLHYEVLPDSRRKAPSHDWRMSHEMAAANMGFVWPNIVFSADSDSVHIWAQASRSNVKESVSFSCGLDAARSIPKTDFTQAVSSLIEGVLAQLQSVGCRNSDLAELWNFISKDLTNPGEHRKRRLEAELGFDPEHCPKDLLTEAVDLDEMIGENSFSELSGAYAENAENRLETMQELVQSEGLKGTPDKSLHDLSITSTGREPWQVAVSAARELRAKLGETHGALKDRTLPDLLGLTEAGLEEWRPNVRHKASIAGSDDEKKLNIILRKTHPIAKRFELARLVGDYARVKMDNAHSCLVAADLSTARQKYQRAFAAEFLCPIDSLVEYLDGDFSETALEDAANHFSVSEKTVEALLMNNRYLPGYPPDSSMPYSLTS
ncbi:MAG: hypothetical protein OXC63_05075 [Aestuariivita sp.]|nr:hypothetical protein [Aestuariivita sp.]